MFLFKQKFGLGWNCWKLETRVMQNANNKAMQQIKFSNHEINVSRDCGENISNPFAYKYGSLQLFLGFFYNSDKNKFFNNFCSVYSFQKMLKEIVPKAI